MPRPPIQRCSGACLVSTLRTRSPLEMAYRCTPNIPCTASPDLKAGLLDFSTVPAEKLRMTSPRPTGGEYDLVSFIQPRMAGSSEIYSILTRISPAPGSDTGPSSIVKSSHFTMPSGRRASLTMRLLIGRLAWIIRLSPAQSHVFGAAASRAAVWSVTRLGLARGAAQLIGRKRQARGLAHGLTRGGIATSLAQLAQIRHVL